MKNLIILLILSVSAISQDTLWVTKDKADWLIFMVNEAFKYKEAFQVTDSLNELNKETILLQKANIKSFKETIENNKKQNINNRKLLLIREEETKQWKKWAYVSIITGGTALVTKNFAYAVLAGGIVYLYMEIDL